MSDSTTAFIPYFKVNRIIQAVIAIALLISWSIRKWEMERYPLDDDVNKYAIFIIDYITNGAFGIIFIIDVICQISGDPIDYTPMFLFLVTASVMYLCCATYILWLVIIDIFEDDIINIIHIVLSFLMTFISIIDIHLLINRKSGYN